MKTKLRELSTARLIRLREQGYQTQNIQQLNELAFGNRFAFQLCVSILSIGVVLADIPILATMMVVAFMSVLLPNHMFDYIYNYAMAETMGKPKLPARSPQLKFACGIATLWIGGIIYLFSNQMLIEGYIMGVGLMSIGGLVATIDYCIPSKIYNALFSKRTKTTTI